MHISDLKSEDIPTKHINGRSYHSLILSVQMRQNYIILYIQLPFVNHSHLGLAMPLITYKVI